MGRPVPLGYEVRDRKLANHEPETKTIRMMSERFAAMGWATFLARTLAAERVHSRRGKLIN
jgi:site-specific DNA recombinase